MIEGETLSEHLFRLGGSFSGILGACKSGVSGYNHEGGKPRHGGVDRQGKARVFVRAWHVAQG